MRPSYPLSPQYDGDVVWSTPLSGAQSQPMPRCHFGTGAQRVHADLVRAATVRALLHTRPTTPTTEAGRETSFAAGTCPCRNCPTSALVGRTTAPGGPRIPSAPRPQKAVSPAASRLTLTSPSRPESQSSMRSPQTIHCDPFFRELVE